MIDLTVCEELGNAVELNNTPDLAHVALLGITDLKFGLDLDRQSSLFSCTSVRQVLGYVGDPSASNGPTLISVPAGVEAIVGGRWDGSKFLTTKTDGSTLCPFTNTSTPDGVVKVFTGFQNYDVSTAFAAGEQCRIKTSAGNYVYMTSSGGTSDSTAVVVTDADIGSTVGPDNDITWTVEGYCTIEGTLLEDVSTTVLLNSDAPATQTTGSLALGNWTLSYYGDGNATPSGNSATIIGGAAASDGSPNTFEVTVAGTVDVTVAGAAAGDYFQLESGDFPTSIIITAGAEVTRSATLLSDTTAGRLSADSGAGRIVYFNTETTETAAIVAFEEALTDGIRILTTPTRTSLYNRIDDVNEDNVNFNITKEVGFFVTDYYWNDTEFGLRTFKPGEAEPSFETTPVTVTPVIAPTFIMGGRPGLAVLANINLLSHEINSAKEDFGW